MIQVRAKEPDNFYLRAMNAVLVPTDFSECADSAVQLAHAIALKSGAHLYFLHMFTDFSEPIHVPQLSDHVISRHPKEGMARARLEKLVEQAEAEGIRSSSIFVYDHGSEKVIDYLDSYEIDLVVMGTHGIGGLKEWLVGSNARYITRHTTIPVLVTKKVTEAFEIRDILFPSVFSHDVSESLGRVVEFAGLFGATIQLLYVNLTGRSAGSGQAEHILEYFSSEYPQASFRINVIDTNDELWGIGEFIQTYPADVIGVSRGEHDSSFFSRSVAESLMQREETPILIV